MRVERPQQKLKLHLASTFKCLLLFCCTKSCTKMELWETWQWLLSQITVSIHVKFIWNNSNMNCGSRRTQLIDLTPNVWLHSSVGRASHRYRGGHGFESRWSPDFFRLLLSNCLNWKIYCNDHSSLSSTTAVQIWIISYTLHIINK